ncbi:hypothetical protein OC834_003420 [Tilletia horrida]|nr:hypothetical protein OC834_003420 [Tilletia horrida]
MTAQKDKKVKDEAPFNVDEKAPLLHDEDQDPPPNQNLKKSIHLLRTLAFLALILACIVLVLLNSRFCVQLPWPSLHDGHEDGPRRPEDHPTRVQCHIISAATPTLNLSLYPVIHDHLKIAKTQAAQQHACPPSPSSHHPYLFLHPSLSGVHEISILRATPVLPTLSPDPPTQLEEDETQLPEPVEVELQLEVPAEDVALIQVQRMLNQVEHGKARTAGEQDKLQELYVCTMHSGPASAGLAIYTLGQHLQGAKPRRRALSTVALTIGQFRPTTASGQLWHAGKILVATVGLPARGKTHLAHALERYLRWLGVKSAVFSLGDYRRRVIGSAESLPKDYFADDGRSESTEALRQSIQNGFDQTVADFFNFGGQVVIYDANNSTQKRRYAIRERFGKMGVSVMFMESICTDQAIVEANVRSVKISSPDYVNWDPEKAVQDFYERIRGHEKHYEPIEAPSFPYIKIINVGQQIIVNNIQGYLQSRIVFFLMNIHNKQRTIYFARAGEALIEHLYKADADLSSLGWAYADRLAEFMEELRHRKAAESEEMSSLERQRRASILTQMPPEQRADSASGPSPASASASGRVTVAAALAGESLPLGTGTTPTGPVAASALKPASLYHDDGEDSRPLEIWTSARRRSSHTAFPFAERGYRVIERPQLSEMNPGVVDGMSVEEIKKRFPDEWEKKQKEPYSHRFPRAESYHDLSVRLEPIIFELERARGDVLIIVQSSVLRCLLAYVQGRKPHEIPLISVHEGELFECAPTAYGVKTIRHEFWDPIKEREERDKRFFHRDEAEGAAVLAAGDAAAEAGIVGPDAAQHAR